MNRFLRTLAAVLLLFPAYAVFAYVVMPVSWRQYHRIAGAPGSCGVTRTLEGIAADPLNVAVVGSEAQVADAMGAAGWTPADRITLRSGWKDATSVLFARPYASAPVSTHVLWGRPQDLAFEQIVGGSPRRRHHVRLWRVNQPSDPRDTLWLGAASYDAKLGFSRYTGEVIHHIDTRVDGERDRLLADLNRGGRLARSGCGAGPVVAGRGRNGAGDAYETDGRLCVAVLGEPGTRRPLAPSLEGILAELRERAIRPGDRFERTAGR
jgi:LssY C-terminus